VVTKHIGRFENLRRLIPKGPNGGCHSTRMPNGRTREVANDNSVANFGAARKQDVFRLDVSMGHPLLVEVLDSSGHLTRDKSDVAFAKTLTDHQGIQVASSGKLRECVPIDVSTGPFYTALEGRWG
jgi:hypothetical protein